jgi:hypothetical protein
VGLLGRAAAIAKRKLTDQRVGTEAAARKRKKHKPIMANQGPDLPTLRPGKEESPLLPSLRSLYLLAARKNRRNSRKKAQEAQTNNRK